MSARTGRPSKGDRHTIVSRVPRRAYEAARADAARRGFDSMSQYLAHLVAREVGLEGEAPAPVAPTGQGEFPMTG